MDGFPAMPGEIVRLIANEAVRARGVKRAVRLRLVNQSWNREITEAMVESGILDDHERVAYSCFWPKFLMHKVRRSDNLPSRRLCLIRRAAQRVVAFRTGKPDSENHEALQDYLWNICQLPQDPRGITRFYERWFMPDEQMDPIRDSDEDFKETLLAAAAATNDLALVQELLPTFQDCPYLVYHDGYRAHIPVLGYPLDIAAFQGHVEVLQTLLEIAKDPKNRHFAHLAGVKHASAGNHLDILDVCLQSSYEGHQLGLVKILRKTASIPIFDRLYQVCKDHLSNGWVNASEAQLDRAQMQVEFLSTHFRWAALNGNLALMKHLVQLGSRRTHVDRRGDDEDGYFTLVSSVAARGHADVLTYLLENGAQLGSRSLEAACHHGNPDIVRILLEHGARDSYKPGSALLESVKRENETALRLLLETSTLVDEDQRRQARDLAENEGLSSIAKILEEY